MNAIIKLRCEFTVRDIEKQPAAEDARAELEYAMGCCLWDNVTITEYEQEFTDES